MLLVWRLHGHHEWPVMHVWVVVVVQEPAPLIHVVSLQVRLPALIVCLFENAHMVDGVSHASVLRLHYMKYILK